MNENENCRRFSERINIISFKHYWTIETNITVKPAVVERSINYHPVLSKSSGKQTTQWGWFAWEVTWPNQMWSIIFSGCKQLSDFGSNAVVRPQHSFNYIIIYLKDFWLSTLFRFCFFCFGQGERGEGGWFPPIPPRIYRLWQSNL